MSELEQTMLENEYFLTQIISDNEAAYITERMKLDLKYGIITDDDVKVMSIKDIIDKYTDHEYDLIYKSAYSNNLLKQINKDFV